ncbi:hypothetical protein [Actinoplanes sp. NPDC051851]|uniref:hypothetical protein n=1 Tax=Actinoplanes sp. NPDC051851 TaxID=3154753 RepID=UPI00341E19B7
MLLADRFLWPDAIGELVVGTALIGWPSGRLDLAVSTPVALVAGALLVVCGALIYFAIKLAPASVASGPRRATPR